MRRITIPYERSGRTPGTWSTPADFKMRAPAFRAVFCCPLCGRLSIISDHAIDEGGQVEPELACPHSPCNFREIVKLEGWKPTVAA
jgi:hypothetical protein